MQSATPAAIERHSLLIRAGQAAARANGVDFSSHKLTRKEVGNLVDMVAYGGYSTAEAGRVFGITQKWACELVQRNGDDTSARAEPDAQTELRSRCTSAGMVQAVKRRGGRLHLPDDERQAIVDAVTAGRGIATVARAFDVSRTTVRRHARKAGVLR